MTLNLDFATILVNRVDEYSPYSSMYMKTMQSQLVLGITRTIKFQRLHEEFRWKLRAYSSIFTNYLTRLNQDMYENDRGLSTAGVFRSHEAYHYANDDDVYFPDRTIAICCCQTSDGVVIPASDQ